jgi:hypothetical protein
MIKKILIAIIALVCIGAIGLGAFAYANGLQVSEIINGVISHFNNAPDTVDFEVTVNDTLPNGEGKEVTVILLGGQSNASGCSSDEYLKNNVSPEQYAEYENGYDNVYINYYDTGSNISNGFVKCGARQGEAGAYFGPELGIADKLNEQYPERTFFIIKCAWGGTNLYDQWRAPSSIGETGDLYLSYVKFVNASLEYLESKNYDVKIEAMCWMQGESDSFSEIIAKNYEKNLTDFIADIRTEFAEYSAPDGIAFIDAYISDSQYWVHFDTVNRAKQAVADSSDMNVAIDTVSAGLTYATEPFDAPDLAHYDSLSQIKLGHMFATEIVKYLD